ncbi:hypothetical protein Tco_0589334 [Tanacetum coccineum]
MKTSSITLYSRTMLVKNAFQISTSVGDSCIAKNSNTRSCSGDDTTKRLVGEREKCVLVLASPKGNVKILSHNTGHGGMIPELNTGNTNTLICNDTTLCQDICEQNIASPTVTDDDLQEQEKAIRGRDEQLVCSRDPETPLMNMDFFKN